MWNEIKNKYPYANAVLLVVIIVLCAIYVFSGNGSSGQTSYSAVENKLNDGATGQRKLTGQLEEIGAGIGESKRTLGDIRSESGGVRTAIDEARSTNRNSYELIQDIRKQLAECQSIVDSIQEGNPSGNSGAETKK